MIVQTQQHWLPKALDVVLTLLAWYAFLWLMAGGIGNMLEQGVRITFSKLPPQLLATALNVLTYTAMGVALTVLLLVWAKYNQIRAGRYTRRARIPDMCDSRLSVSFGVHPSVVQPMRGESRLVFHNDHNGDLERAHLPGLGDTINVREPIPARHEASPQ